MDGGVNSLFEKTLTRSDWNTPFSLRQNIPSESEQVYSGAVKTAPQEGEKMLNKNTLLDLWTALSNIPTKYDEGSAPVVIDEPFLGWPSGTNVETIWRWFDEQFAEFGGVHALMYDA